jgi:hypothetical protein
MLRQSLKELLKLQNVVLPDAWGTLRPGLERERERERERENAVLPDAWGSLSLSLSLPPQT